MPIHSYIFGKSTTAREKFLNVQKTLDHKQTPLELIQEVDTRWNSTYAMFKRFVVLQKSLNVILCEEYMPDNLSIEEWNFMEALTMILEPLKEATEDTSGDSYPTISHYFPMYFALMHILEEESAENALITNISNSVRNALKERFEPIIQSNWIYYHSMLLDSRFKDHLLQSTEKHIIHEQFNKRISTIYNETNDNNKEQDNIPSTSKSCAKNSKLSHFFDKTLGNTEEGPETFTTRKNREIQTYLAENVVPRKTNIIDWWKSNQTRFPILSRAAKDCLAVPATQVKSECLFSTAGNVVLQTRARLLPVNVRGLCFLHENIK
ncbi:uncharacterized protein LOC143344609 [Colletes latitarsis]|uniref:uncharacterized protein LOC143344609 n=1 Tax=Colletes latitarsis TaxID=2605962 RepID=UPI004036697B